MKNEIDGDEWKFFLTGGIDVGEELPENPATWLETKSWGEMNRMAKMSNFVGYIEHFNEHHHTYKEMYDSPNPHEFELPGGWNDKLDIF